MTDLQAILDAGGPWEQARIIGDQLLIQGDCREVMEVLPKVCAVVTDPPYGVTDHKWDVVVPAGVWMIAPAAIVTATEPFATALINAAPLRFLYDMVWVKNCASNSMNAKRMPMRRHERVLIFGQPYYTAPKRKRTTEELARLNMEQRERYPDAAFDSVLDIPCVNNRSGDRTSHPSQKPEDLMGALVGAFSSRTQTILDPFMGSGTTLVACQRLGRQGIGIELDPEYYAIACKRVQEVVNNPPLFTPAPPKPTQDAMDL